MSSPIHESEYHSELTEIDFELLSGRKVADAIFGGSDYQKELLNSFNEVQKQSDHLMQKAQNSHYEQTRARETKLLDGQAKHSADVKNMFLSLANIYARDLNRHLEELRRKDEVWKQHQDAQGERRHQGNLDLITTSTRLFSTAKISSASQRFLHACNNSR